MRIAVVGAGGTGGYFGGLLARAGQDVTFIARGAHLEALRARGLTVESKLAGTFTVPVQATAERHRQRRAHRSGSGAYFGDRRGSLRRFGDQGARNRRADGRAGQDSTRRSVGGS